MKTWLVTGAAGFIGSNVTARILEKGDRVIGLDNFSTGRRSNIDRLSGAGHNLFSFIKGDVRDPEAVRDVLHESDCVVHLAAQISVQRSIDDPVETDSINIGGFMSLVDAAGKANVQKVIYASSCAVYGDNPKLPLDEDERPRPLSPYAVSKYANDLYAEVLSRLNSDLELVGLRFFNIFGAWQDASGGYAAVIPRWISLLAAGEQATIFGDGNATRDFCHVDNVSSAIINIGERDEPAPHNVFNIGTGVQTSLSELHRTVVDAIEEGGRTVSCPEPTHLPWRDGDIVHSVASIDRARDTLGYNPDTTLQVGIRRMLTEEYGLKFDGTSN